jgi:hypothetical protein
MKKLLLTALALGAGLSACGDKKEGGDDATSENTETPKAQLASFLVS